MSGDTIAANSEEVLIDGIPSPNGNHNAGDLHFGKDGKLYVSVGDGACDYAEPGKCQAENDASRDKNILLGKILRINPDGSIPQDNPYAQSGNLCGPRGGDARTAPGNNCKETFASGLRNPFRMAFDPDAPGTSFRINDVDWRYIEEVDQGRSGADYGWYCREGTRVNSNTGACDPAPNGMVKPIHQYGHSDGCSSITGSAFVPDRGAWPDSYDDAYLYGDYVCGRIFKLKPKGGGGFERTNFATGLGQGGPVSMAFEPSGDDLYYTTFVGGGQVHRISYVAGNNAPIASASATNGDYGPQDKPFQFSGSGSTDPDSGDTLTYEWDFDYAAGSFTKDADGVTATHTYTMQGPKKAALRVTDDRGASDVVEVPVYPGNTAPPEPVIELPAPGKTFVVGEEIELSGSATDESGETPTLEWAVSRHHTAPNTHTHPFKEGTGANLTFLAPGPEDLFSTDPAGNYLEVRLTATDSQGLQKTVTRDLKPQTTEVNFATGPTGFRLYANGQTFKGPRTLLSWEGYGLNVYAPPQRQDGRDWVFKSWSDGRGARHTIVTPEDPAGYKASFRRK